MDGGSIDVVVPVCGNYSLTRDCLADLSAQTAAHRTIVVDDGSPDDTRARLVAEWPAVEVVEMGANRGYTRAVNRGVREGEGEYVVLLNNDVRLPAGFLASLVAPLREDERVGSVASVMLRPDRATVDSFGVSVDATLAGFARMQGWSAEVACGEAPRRPVLAGPEGTAGAYRRTAWEQVGGLDERIVAYMEIVDLALRLQAAGWRAAEAEGAVGVHLGSRTYGRRSPEQRRLAGFSRGYLLRRYGVLRSRRGARALATEALVVGADALVCRDLGALRGRLAGWRAARGLERHPPPPPAAIDPEISLRASLALRRGAVSVR